MEHSVVERTERLLENPVMRVVAATSLLLVALRGVTGLLFGVVDVVGIFESLFLDRLWNLAQGEWLAIFIVLGAWFVLGSMMKLDSKLLVQAAGGFFLLAAFMANVQRDLPDVLGDLYSLLPSTLVLFAAGVGLVTLCKSVPAGFEAAGLFGTASSNLGLGGGAPASAETSPRVESPAVTTPSVPAPVAPMEAGWLPDPRGEARFRYWDGSAWTDHTHNG
mgnify:CR=1 FL=1